MISGIIFLPLGIYDLSTVQYNWLKSIWCCPICRFIPMRFESLIQIEKSYFWLYLHKGKPPNMNPKASNWNDFYTMTDSVIICIESFIRCRLYLEMYPIQVFTLLIWFKVRLFVRKFVVRPSLSWSALIRTWFVQFTDGPCTSYLLRFCCLLRRFNIQMKVLEDV